MQRAERKSSSEAFNLGHENFDIGTFSNTLSSAMIFFKDCQMKAISDFSAKFLFGGHIRKLIFESNTNFVLEKPIGEKTPNIPIIEIRDKDAKDLDPESIEADSVSVFS